MGGCRLRRAKAGSQWTNSFVRAKSFRYREFVFRRLGRGARRATVRTAAGDASGELPLALALALVSVWGRCALPRQTNLPDHDIGEHQIRSIQG